MSEEGTKERNERTNGQTIKRIVRCVWWNWDFIFIVGLSVTENPVQSVG